MNEITITLKNGTKKKYPKGITYYEISQDLKFKKNTILGVKVNNEINPLDSKATTDANLEFFDMSDLAGYKMYKSALKFLFEVAAKEVIKNCRVHFLHSVPRGILSEIHTQGNLTNEDVKKIKEKMNEIVDSEELYQKYNLLKKDAYNYFLSLNEKEKAKNIQNTSNEVITFYKLKDKINYYYNYMPRDTKCINKYDLVYIGKNRIIIVCPNKEDKEVPDYVHYDNIIDNFMQSKKWLSLMGVPYLSDLNDLVSQSKIREFMATNELIFNESILNVANEIVSRRDIKIVLIAGPSSSGKTTTTKRLSTYIKAKGFDPIAISTDDFFVDREDTPLTNSGEYDYECLEAIDLKLFRETIIGLLKGEEKEIPEYDFVIGKKQYNNHNVKLKKNSILLIEGLHCLNDELMPYIKDENKFKIYLSPFIPLNIDRHNYISTLDLRLLRRIIRDNRTRGKKVDQTIQEWQIVRSGEEKYIFPYVHQADVIINTALSYELGVLKIYAEPLLYSVDINSPYYEEARRLLNSLKNFYPISSEYVKDDSILREFIG